MPATPVTRHDALERCLRLCVCICVCMCVRMDVPSSEDASLGFVRSGGSASNKPPRLSLSLRTVPRVPTSSLRPPIALASLRRSTRISTSTVQPQGPGASAIRPSRTLIPFHAPASHGTGVSPRILRASPRPRTTSNADPYERHSIFHLVLSTLCTAMLCNIAQALA